MSFNLKSKGKIIVAVILIVSLGWSCKVPSHSAYHYQEPESTTPLSSAIVFLSFKILEDTSGTTFIQLIDKHVVEGTLKKEDVDSQSKDKLVIKQLDNQKAEIGKMAIDHPLLKSVEFVNESNAFETKFIKLDSAEFFVRIKLNPKTVYIHIEEIRDDKAGMSTLFSIK
jgi:hypothetical protein